MKRLVIFFVILNLFQNSFTQTNTFPASGNVGIGTINPQYTLDINGQLNTTGTNNDRQTLASFIHNGQSTFFIQGQWGSRDLGSNNGTLLYNNIGVIGLRAGLSNGSAQFVLDNSGNVGIGTTNPQERLDINGTLKLSSNIYWSWSNRAIEEYADADGISKLIRFRNSMNANQGNPNGGFDFADYQGNSVMRINNFNVLIGKTAQINNSYKLDVAGNARINKVVVNTTGADFVFDSNYQLTPLNEVSKYIQQNKHLPNIEPAKQMQQNGLDLGDNQTKLLQKIEELTLYLIEIKKENEEMKKEIELLKVKK